ncbi:hypothetical protein HNQ77_001530 [Silvibacterium bohemicum]|uniref:Uncharacterized protein n=1 Tax=Silvibacterium bohemicum TaxID=1577686 RepID=A0A841JX70_9BACT|nr:hypothetical protein [Silvibacterium bohemicum]MBB6143581.1 hypothetical protein [Silvibacterium bohemicum]
MATLAENPRGTTVKPSSRPQKPRTKPGTNSAVLPSWLRAQSINVTRHAAALRPFKREEFGTGQAAPSEGHIQVVNDLITGLRGGLLKMSRKVHNAIGAAGESPTSRELQRVVTGKDKAHRWVQGIEKIWDFYFELFGQRQGKYGDWLLSCDRIAMDCYQAAYTGLGTARTIPSPPPFCYMKTGFAPATIRRGIRMRRLGKQQNPFPLIQLPYHRLVNPWTLGAVMHEVMHNLQSDLGLSRDIPKHVAMRLLKAGIPRSTVSVWVRWNREMFADMGALLLGGPEVVGSLMDVIGRAPQAVMAFRDGGVHPTPMLRLLISAEMLRRLGFEKEARAYARAWNKIYPNPRAGTIPKNVIDTFSRACALAVDTMCFKPYPSLGNKSLSQVIRFEKKDQEMIEEAAGRMAAGNDPGIISERYLISAARYALNHRLARPGVITKNFYKELVRR